METEPLRVAAVGAPKSRVAWVDAAKGIGIILVVVGHVQRGLISSDILTWTKTTQFIDDWIYAFHMPLFFFISGLFLFQSVGKPWQDFVWGKVATIAYPYFTWSAITIVIKASLGSAVSQPSSFSDLSRILYEPIGQFWFLYVLFILLIAVSAVLKLGIGRSGVFILAVLIYAGVLPMSGASVLYETRAMAIYVALGLLVGNDKTIRAFSRLQIRWLAVGGVTCLMVFSMAVWGASAYLGSLELLFAIVPMVGVIILSRVAVEAKLGAAIRFLGQNSLEIFLVHTIASAGVRMALVHVAHIAAPAPHYVLGVLGGIYVPIALVLLFDRIGFRYGFALPKELTVLYPGFGADSSRRSIR